MGGYRAFVTAAGFVGVLVVGSAAMTQCAPTSLGGGTTATTVAPTTTTVAAPATTVAPTTTTATTAPIVSGSSPLALLVPSSTAFAVLGHSCGGIQEQAFATGFDATSGVPTGDVYLQTRCGGSGRGGGYTTTTYSAWVGVTWDFAGAVQSSVTLTAAPANLSPTFSAVDAAGDDLYNVLSAVNVLPANCVVTNTSYCTYRAYLSVVVPPAPTAVTAVQSGDAFQVGWVPYPATSALITSSTVTATPVASTAPVLTATQNGPATSALVGPLQPDTTYQVTVANTDAGGTSPPSTAITVATPPSTVVPSAPTGVSALWTAPQAAGDTLAASWSAAVPGDSPIDQYEITVTVSDGGSAPPGPFTQTVSGSTLAVSFTVADTLDWSVTVHAHNAAGWGPQSTPVVLPAA